MNHAFPKLQRSPLFIPVLFFMAGIGVANFYFIAFVFIHFYIDIVYWQQRKIVPNSSFVRWRINFFILAFSFFLLGFLIRSHREETSQVVNEKIELDSVLLTFHDGVRFSKRGAWTIAQLHFNKNNIDVLVNMDSAVASVLEKGDSLYFNSTSVYPLLKAERRPNSWESYLIRQGVSAKIYVKNKQEYICYKNKTWYYFAYNFMHRKILKSQLSTSSKSLLLSLLIGDRGYIDKETKDKFSEVGVSHILSVSGLHVGIIYLIISFVIGLIWNKHAYVSLGIILVLIWFYCWMVGFEAAVLRSALMFSLHAIGNAIGRKSSLLHTTSLSAFIILVINPNFLYDIGFQLTYGAMLGIIFLMPLLQDKVKVKYSFLKPVIDLMLLSLAVQITLLPLLIYHFQTLPIYFMVANLLVVPATALIMYGGIVFLILPENQISNTLLDLLVLVNDACCTMICEWPYPLVFIKEISPLNICLYSFVVISVVLYWATKMNAFLFVSCLILVLLFV